MARIITGRHCTLIITLPCVSGQICGKEATTPEKNAETSINIQFSHLNIYNIIVTKDIAIIYRCSDQIFVMSFSDSCFRRFFLASFICSLENWKRAVSIIRVSETDPRLGANLKNQDVSSRIKPYRSIGYDCP